MNKIENRELNITKEVLQFENEKNNFILRIKYWYLKYLTLLFFHQE